MQAVILVGGKATRLRPLTFNTLKAMVPVLNVSFLEHVIRSLSHHHVDDIIVTLSSGSQSIRSCYGDGSQFGVKLNYVVEDAPRGTAGAVKNAERYLQGAFLVLNGDIFTDLDISAMLEFHRQREAKATIALTPVDDPTSYGLVEVDTQGRVTRFLEKPGRDKVTTNMINAGIYVLEADILAQIPSQGEFSFERELFPSLLEQGKPVYAYPSFAYWMDIGTPEKYLRLHWDLLNGKSSQHTFAPGEDTVIGKQSYVHPSAQMKGAVLIGDNCHIGREVKLTGPIVIGSGCTIESGAEVEGSVIWHSVQIGRGVLVRNSVIANNSSIHYGCRVLDGLVLGSNVVVFNDYQLEP
ncbi:sugar phosphate nucleotidyltransferase, partial [Chloroflexota bacterium]